MKKRKKVNHPNDSITGAILADILAHALLYVTVGRLRFRMAEKKLGQILIARKMLTENQLVQALQEQMRLNATSKRQFKLGEILLFAKWIQMEVLQQMLLEQKPRSRTDIEALRQQKNQPQQRQLESVQVLSSNSRRLTTPKF